MDKNTIIFFKLKLILYLNKKIFRIYISILIYLNIVVLHELY